jgi:hypothetical protein
VGSSTRNHSRIDTFRKYIAVSSVVVTVIVLHSQSSTAAILNARPFSFLQEDSDFHVIAGRCSKASQRHCKEESQACDFSEARNIGAVDIKLCEQSEKECRAKGCQW